MSVRCERRATAHHFVEHHRRNLKGSADFKKDGRGGSSSWNVSRFTVLCMDLATGRRRVEDAVQGKLVDMYTGSDRHIHGRIGTGRRRMEDAARQVEVGRYV